MNHFIEEQLNKCQVAAIPQHDAATLRLVIPKTIQIPTGGLKEGECYILRLDPVLTNPPPSSTLAVNWNGGSVPKSSYYKCEVTKVMGKMIKINGIEYYPETNQDSNTNWEGWLPIANVKVIQKL